jgi:hypothetical protein
VIEIIVIIIILSILERQRLCPQKYLTLPHVSLSKKRNIIDTWKLNIQEIVTTKFNDHTIYYNIHANNIYTNKVDYITICTEYISTDFFEIRPRNLWNRILIKLNIYNEIQMQNSTLNNLFIVLSNKKLSKNLFDEELQEKLACFFTKEKTFSFKSLKLTNCGEEFCLKFKMNKDLRKKDININKILNSYGNDFLSIFSRPLAYTKNPQKLNFFRKSLIKNLEK